MRCPQVQATAAGTAHAVIVWWQLNLDSAGLITLDTAPCWVTKQADATAPQSSQVPQTGPLPQSDPQLVPAPGAAPLHASSTTKELSSHASHQSQLAGPTQSSSQAGSSGLACSIRSPLAEAAPPAAAAAASLASVALPEECLGYEQACRPESEQQQQWRDHWKQCWTPVQAPFRLGKLWSTRNPCSVMSSGSMYSFQEDVQFGMYQQS